MLNQSVRPLGSASPYDVVDGAFRLMAGPSSYFAAMSRILDDREFLPPFAEALARLPGMLEMRRFQSARYAALHRLSTFHGKPAFGIASVEIEGQTAAVTEETVKTVPFCRLLRFGVEGGGEARPRILLVAPMAGHYATLMRETVRDLLPYSDVYVTDWANARDVPASEGAFDLDDYIDILRACIGKLAPDVHVLAICQAGVPTLAALALMEEEAEGKNASLPASVTIMGSPIDTRVGRTEVNEFAGDHSADWFSENLIATVPGRFEGAGRSVYPGYLQLTAFLAMNPERHQKSFRDGILHFTRGEFEREEKTDAFYAEFFSVMDLTAAFYLQTVATVFQEQRLARGTMEWRGRPVRPDRITRTPILAVEAERDDICGLGQTRAALDLAAGLPDASRRYFCLERAGHYGLFNGSRFRTILVPTILDHMKASRAS